MVATGRARRLPRGYRDVILQSRKAWLARALAIGPAHRPRVESALATVYAQAGLPEAVVMWRASPASGAQVVADLVELAQAGPRGRRSVGPLAVDRVLDGVLDALDRALRPSLYGTASSCRGGSSRSSGCWNASGASSFRLLMREASGSQ